MIGALVRLTSRLGPKREVIGPPNCPLMNRWTLFWRGSHRPKLLLHHFLPNRQDMDAHDHPRGFITIVLAGGYDDLVACPWHHSPQGACEPAYEWAEGCGGTGFIVGDRLRAGSIRRRHAEYTHMTRTDHRGAWTLCLMFPVSRAWGFWRNGTWFPFRLYEARFGMAMRCDDGPLTFYNWDGTGAGEGG